MRSEGMKRHWLAMVSVVSLIGIGLSWPSASLACTVTTATPAQPTGVAATADDEGIHLQWNAAADTDQVFQYNILRGEGTGTVLTLFVTIWSVSSYNVTTDTESPPPEPDTSITFNKHDDFMESGVTYFFRVVAVREDNCGGSLESTPSEQVSATFPEY